MIDLHSTIPIITLIINDQSTPIKNLDFKEEQDPNICCLEESYFKYKNTNRPKLKGGKRYTMWALITNISVDFRAKDIVKDKEVHLINDKGLNSFKGHRILNGFMPNNRAANYMKKNISLWRNIDKPTIIDGVFNTPLNNL